MDTEINQATCDQRQPAIQLIDSECNPTLHEAGESLLLTCAVVAKQMS